MRDLTAYRHKPEYHLYIDEANVTDHWAVLGCIISWDDHQKCRQSFETLKAKHFPGLHSVKKPIIFHRRKIARRECPFGFPDTPQEHAFYKDLAEELTKVNFKTILALLAFDRSADDSRLDAYVKSISFLLFRYCQYLHQFGAAGDVWGEAIGPKESTFLKLHYQEIRSFKGAERQSSQYYRQVLTSKNFHIESKVKNIPGLQIADLLVAPMMRKYLSIGNTKVFDRLMQEVGEAKELGLLIRK